MALSCKRKTKFSSDSETHSPEGKKICGSPRTDADINIVFDNEDQDQEARKLTIEEKIVCQLESICVKLAGVEERLQNMERIFERFATLENSVNSIQIELNTLNDKSKSVEDKAVEIEKAMEFANTEIEELKKKDKENEDKIKELEGKLLYQEVYNRRENLRFFGIPEAASGAEDTAKVVHHFFKEELELEDGENIEFQRAHRIVRSDLDLDLKSVKCDDEGRWIIMEAEEIQNFYSNLCKRDPLSPSEDMLSPFLNNPEIPKLSNNDARTREGKLTVDECYKSLQLFESNKSPGNDGLTVEFYRAFWYTLGNLMVDSLNYSYDYGELSNSQKQAIITLIEKKDEDRRDLANWRPISLINVDVKIGSKPIAKRLENVLPNIIHHNQSAYVKGRTISDAVRTIEDVMEFSKRYNIEGRMICLDFKKAFDTVSRDFLFRTLSAFGFGPSFTQWINTFYNNISSCVLNNGFSTSSFAVERGVRQGDPLSAHLFIIVLEILCISIRNSKDIRGIKVDNEEIKLSLFADDLTAFSKNNLSVKNFLKLIDEYGNCSGLGNHGYAVQEDKSIPVKAADKTPVIAAHAARGTLTGKPTTVTAVPRLEAERTLDKPPIEIAE
ncbi:hypothetical protein ACROYT_G005059 [Oculina patagonica]